jgi:tetratricopeptide (TPR) repeat protein
MQGVSAKADALLENKKDNSLQEKTFQELLGLSDKTMLWLYGVGYQCFEHHQKEEAIAIFQMLTLLNPLICDYWIALGITQRGLEEDSDALNSFEMASMMDAKNPIPRYNSIEIHLKQKHTEEAKKEFHLLEEIVKNQHRDDLRPALDSVRSKLQLSNAS